MNVGLVARRFQGRSTAPCIGQGSPNFLVFVGALGGWVATSVCLCPEPRRRRHYGVDGWGRGEAPHQHRRSFPTPEGAEVMGCALLRKLRPPC